MARGGLIIAGVAVLAVAGLALAAGEAQAASGPGRAPPPPPPPNRGRTPKQIAQAHPLYAEWLAAAEQCDGAYDSAGNPLVPLDVIQDWCGNAGYLGGLMVSDGVPPGDWR